jgi:hypothetical protein
VHEPKQKQHASSGNAQEATWDRRTVEHDAIPAMRARLDLFQLSHEKHATEHKKWSLEKQATTLIFGSIKH